MKTGANTVTDQPPEKRDFFISYNGADKEWAEWIAWTLEDADYTTFIQAWDFHAGGDFVTHMDIASKQSKRTIAVLSDNYLDAEFPQPEWHVAFADDPTGEKRLLLPVRVGQCDPEGLLKVRVYIDLLHKGRNDARRILLAKVEGKRAKPESEPAFPGDGNPRVEPPFPASLPPVFAMPHLRNPEFTGRESLLEQIYRNLKDQS